MATAIFNNQSSFPIDMGRLEKSISLILEKLNCQNQDLNVILVDDQQIKKINKKYRNVNKATNVLSFSMQEGEFGSINPNLMGDIIISVNTAANDAEKGNLEFMDEIEFLVIHGILHLIGYNHENTSLFQARKMERLEKDLFYQLRGYHLE